MKDGLYKSEVFFNQNNEQYEERLKINNWYKLINEKPRTKIIKTIEDWLKEKLKTDVITDAQISRLKRDIFEAAYYAATANSTHKEFSAIAKENSITKKALNKADELNKFSDLVKHIKQLSDLLLQSSNKNMNLGNSISAESLRIIRKQYELVYKIKGKEYNRRDSSTIPEEHKPEKFISSFLNSIVESTSIYKAKTIKYDRYLCFIYPESKDVTGNKGNFPDNQTALCLFIKDLIDRELIYISTNRYPTKNLNGDSFIEPDKNNWQLPSELTRLLLGLSQSEKPKIIENSSKYYQKHIKFRNKDSKLRIAGWSSSSPLL